MNTQNEFYVQEVRYSGFAGAKTGYVQSRLALLLMLLAAPMTTIAESKFLSLDRDI